MTKYYLEVLKDDVSICLDTDIRHYHQFEIGDIINIHMYITVYILIYCILSIYLLRFEYLKYCQ